MAPEIDRNWRHILALSGGKDSSALAVYMKTRIPEMEYVFCDTDKELDETYEYLNRLEVYLERKIVRLKTEGMGFDDLLKMRRGFLPSPQMRWCTEYLKIKPYEKYIGDDNVFSYVGIRADEMHRKRYISTKPNIIAKYPFIEKGIRRKDVIDILNTTFVGGKPIGLPNYYDWRSRSGCYFCFYQQRREWVGLLENHPDLFQKAMEYEKQDPETGEHYSWVQERVWFNCLRRNALHRSSGNSTSGPPGRQSKQATVLFGTFFPAKLRSNLRVARSVTYDDIANCVLRSQRHDAMRAGGS